MDDNNNVLNESIDSIGEKKPVDTSDINYETALQVLIEELEKAGVWESNFRAKVAVKILSAKLLIQERKINEALEMCARNSRIGAADPQTRFWYTDPI
jgi:chemotaxis receptor (MCP) glutamine deamidase CheD